jgi:precorrin-2 dehydrogenase / sirohydrochlorin ferrochelatase
MPTYPIELDLVGRTVVVVGLGTVGRRKAAGLVESGARVIGVDPRAEEAPPGVELRLERYRIQHLDGASLVFAAATPEVNREVVADARRLGLWVNSASEPAEGDFLLPAVWRDGPLTLTVSTSGASPALAAALRDRAVSALGPSAAGLARLLAELRPEVLERIADPAVRKRVLAEAADPRWIDFFASEGAETTRTALRAFLGIEPGKPEIRRPDG